MRRLEARWALGIGAVLVMVMNATILGTAAWNRSGEPTATLELTERELAMPMYRDKDDTGLVLSLELAERPPAAVGLSARYRGTELAPLEHRWLDGAKLREIGFDPAAADGGAAPGAGGHPPGSLPRLAFVVLENGGEAWRAWIAAREGEVDELRARVEQGLEDRGKLVEAEALLAIDRTSRSRLMPVDVGVDPDRLRERYPDRRRYAVIRALIALEPAAGTGGPGASRGAVRDLDVSGIHVPLSLLPRLAPFVPRVDEKGMYRHAREESAKGWPPATPPRYRATVAVGRLYSPWLVDAGPIEETGGR